MLMMMTEKNERCKERDKPHPQSRTFRILYLQHDSIKYAQDCKYL